MVLGEVGEETGGPKGTRMYNAPQVGASLGHRSRATTLNHVVDGLITQPVYINARTTRWPAEEIDTIRACRIAGADDSYVRHLVATLMQARADRLRDLGLPPIEAPVSKTKRPGQKTAVPA